MKFWSHIRPTCQSGGTVALLLMCFISSASAVAFGPPLTLFQDIPPGFEVDLKKVGNFSYQIVNKSNADQDYRIKTSVPHGEAGTWEHGYEIIPDISWCTMHESELTVAANTTKLVSMTINIPDKPENYNRKFMVYVVLEPGGQAALGVGLGLIARVMIETSVKPGPEFTGHSNALGIAPGQINIKGKPGDAFSKNINVMNHGGDSEFMICKLPDFYPTLKFARYQTNGFQLMPNNTWVEGLELSKVKKGETKKIAIKGKISPEAKIGMKYEELIFFKPTTVTNIENEEENVRKLRIHAKMNFLRIQYIVE